MSDEDRKARLSAAQRLTAAGVGISLLLVILVGVRLATREDSNAEDTSISPPLSEATTRTTELDTRTVVVERLRDILRVRDKAFHDRNSQILEDIYTVDCPCLKGDSNAIKELVSNDYHVLGGETSIRVRRVEQVSEQLWLVVADFKSSALRIQTKDGNLIREEPAEEDLFQFALSKPNGSAEWLLGRATAYREGSG